MKNNLLSKYEDFKNQTYNLASLEFQLTQAKLNLSIILNNTQLKLFQEYEKLSLTLISKKEFQFIEFAIKELNLNQLKKDAK